MQPLPDQNISLAERQKQLWVASRQYMRREISLETLEAIERLYTPFATSFLPQTPDPSSALTNPSPQNIKEGS